MGVDLDRLLTEARNPKTKDIDSMQTVDILTLINEEDKSVPIVVSSRIPLIAEAVDRYVKTIRSGGRIFYVGAGTSGRLGIIDAAECPPTFRTPPDLVRGLIAGGPDAVFRAKEGAEDSAADGMKAVSEAGVRAGDLVIGLAASGRTPWVVAALKRAKEVGARTVGIDCTPNSELSDLCDLCISVPTGPEVIAGSTRMKAATAQKLILTMISTASMIKLGKVYGNLMVDLQPWSEKLRSRARKILALTTGLSPSEADRLLQDAGYNVKVALVMAKTGQDREKASELLKRSGGFVRKAIELGGGQP